MPVTIYHVNERSMSHDYVISVDLGGTNLRVGAVRDDGLIEEREKRSSEAKATTSEILQNIEEAIRTIVRRLEEKQKTIRGITLGFPGIVDSEKGIVYQSPHFPDWKNLVFVDYFRKKFPWPIKASNDANLAALGESWLGAGKGLKNFVMMTLGTGIGGGIMIDGKIFHGDHGFAGEIGHIVIEAEGHECPCGSRGCLEMYVSTLGIRKLIETADDVLRKEQLLERVGGNLDKITVQALYELAREGDILAHSTFKKMGYYLGIGLATLVNTLGIENFVIGGGISEAWDFFVEVAKKELAARTYSETARYVKLLKAQLGDDAGLIGGARF